jgi:hypothetical protein
MRSKDITRILKDYFETDFTVKSRDRRTIYIRALNNALCRELTNESLSMIGRNYYSSDHATVLHSIKMFNDNYIHQTSPINMKEAYLNLEFMLRNTEDVEVNSHKEIEDKMIFLNERVWKLESELKLARYSLKKSNLKREDLEERFEDIFADLKTLSDADLLDFYETRLKPYKRALESRVIPKKIEKVYGALLNQKL